MKRLFKFFKDKLKRPSIYLDELKNIEAVAELQNCDSYLIVRFKGDDAYASYNCSNEQAVHTTLYLSQYLKQVDANQKEIDKILSK